MAITKATSSVLADNAALNNLNAGASIAFTKPVSVSGNLTVDTNTLFVDSVNDRVGIGTITPNSALHVIDDWGTIQSSNTISSGFSLFPNSGNPNALTIFRQGSTTTRAFFIGINSGNTEIGTTNGSISFNTNTLHLMAGAGGNVGIGTTTPAEKLTVSGNISATGNITCTGHLAAATKSFKIPHQTKAGYLQYGVVESNEHSVYIRGKTSDDTITLPDHWSWLVDSDSVTVTLTPYGSPQSLYIISADNKKVVVGGVTGEYHYVIYGTRQDVEALVVETEE